MKNEINKALIKAEALIYLNLPHINLGNIIEYIETHNKSNNIPYHNLDHLIGVTMWSGRLAAIEGSLYHPETKALLLAAMFHDFNHSSGRNKDSWNIKQATDALEIYCKNNKISSSVMLEAYYCIKTTEFPFIRDPETDQENIIRDADLLYGLSIDYESIIVDGLRKEIEISSNSQIDRAEFAKKNKEFRDSLYFFTESATTFNKLVSPVMEKAYEQI